MPGPTVGPDGDQTRSLPHDPSEASEASEEAPTGAPFGRATVLTLGGLVALAPLTTDFYLPALPDLTADLHSTAPVAQLTLTGSLIGMVIGQLLFGPLSDRTGRRRPMLIGMAVYTASGVLCALAGSMPVLIAGRVLQGVAGSAALVVARAVVRDRLEGVAMIRFLATMSLISGLAPILAPVAGAQLLHVTDWRGIFLALAALGALLTTLTALFVGETLPPERRHTGGLGSTFGAIGGLLRDRCFLGYLLTSTFAFGALFAYVGGSSVVLQEVYRVSPQTYSLVFAVNSVVLVLSTQLNGRVLVQRFPGPRLLAAGLAVAVLAGAAVVLFTTVWPVGLAGVWPGLAVLMGSMGVIMPNANGRALTMAPHAAGSASALLGTGTFLCGALVAPASSLGGHPSATALGVVVLGCALLALGSFALLGREKD